MSEPPPLPLPPPPFTIFPRSDWCTIPPRWSDYLQVPVKYVYCTYTRRSFCYDKEECFRKLMILYNRHIKFGDKPDIAYNFLIGGDGSVYEGRGWTCKASLPKRHHGIQNRTLAIAMIGSFQDRQPSALMKKVQNMLIRYGMDNNLIEKKITQWTT